MKRLAVLAVGFLTPIALLVGCQQPGVEATNGGGAPMLATAMDTIQFGRNVVIHHGCGDCHGGADNPSAPVWLSGARDTIFGQFRIPTPDGKVFLTRPRNLTPDNETGMGRYSERQIFNALRYGLRPNQTPDVEITSTTPGQGNFPEAPKFLAPPMPWPAFRHMSDQELWAIAAYLKRAVKPVANLVADSEGPPDFWAGLYGQVAGPVPPSTFPTAQEQAPPPQ